MPLLPLIQMSDTVPKLMPLDAWAVDMAYGKWLNKISVPTQRSYRTVLKIFQREMKLDLAQLLFDARKAQSTDVAVEVLKNFHVRLISLGMKPSSARQYCNNLSAFFTANRFPLPMLFPKAPVEAPTALMVVPVEGVQQ